MLNHLQQVHTSYKAQMAGPNCGTRNIGLSAFVLAKQVHVGASPTQGRGYPHTIPHYSDEALLWLEIITIT